MKVDPELAKKMITGQGYTRLLAYDVGKTCMLARFEGSPAECAAEVDELVAQIASPFRLECDSPRYSEKDQKIERPGRRAGLPMVVILQGGYQRGGGLSEALDARLARLETSEDGEDLPEEDSALNVALAKALEALVPVIVQRFGAAAGPQPIQGAPPSPSAPVAGPARPNGGAAELARALHNFQTANPEQYAQYMAVLLNTYGDGAGKT